MTKASTTRTTTTITRTTTRTPPRTSPARPWILTLGWSFLVLALLGLIGFVVDATHGIGFHLEGAQDGAHWVLAIGCLVLAYALRERTWFAAATLAVGILLLALGAFGLLEPDRGAWHAGVVDATLHLLLGTATLLVGIVALNRERDRHESRRLAPPRPA